MKNLIFFPDIEKFSQNGTLLDAKKESFLILLIKMIVCASSGHWINAKEQRSWCNLKIIP
jgi:hypothetical protein